METKKSPKYYVMHPSSARHYSDLCHLKTFLPLLSFPSISEPGCQLTGEEPISQSSFFPFPPGKPAHLAALPPGAEAAGSPCQGVHHRSNPEAGAGTQTCPACIPPPPGQAFPQGGCRTSHATATGRDGRAGPRCRGWPSPRLASRGDRALHQHRGVPSAPAMGVQGPSSPMLLAHAGSD